MALISPVMGHPQLTVIVRNNIFFHFYLWRIYYKINYIHNYFTLCA